MNQINGAKLSKRGRMVLPQNAPRKSLALTVVVASIPAIKFAMSVNDELVAWKGNTFVGDNWTLKDFEEALG